MDLPTISDCLAVLDGNANPQQGKPISLFRRLEILIQSDGIPALFPVSLGWRQPRDQDRVASQIRFEVNLIVADVLAV